MKAANKHSYTINLFFWVIVFTIPLISSFFGCAVGIEATQLKAYSTFDPFSTLPKPEPTPIKTQITTEVTK